MKAYTDIEQSRKLAKILPLESADMCYIKREINDTFIETPILKPIGSVEKSLCCWSLAALFGVLPFHLIVNNQRYAFSMVKGLDKNGETYAIKYTIFNTTIYFHLTDFYNNPVDTCVEMIFKLNELKML